MSKRELIFIFPLLQLLLKQFKVLADTVSSSRLFHRVGPDYPFTEKMLSQVGPEPYFL